MWRAEAKRLFSDWVVASEQNTSLALKLENGEQGGAEQEANQENEMKKTVCGLAIMFLPQRCEC
jgi:hypothetical protein